jgi:hypothetical protein
MSRQPIECANFLPMRASKFPAKLAHERHGSSPIFRTGLFFCLLIDLCVNFDNKLLISLQFSC